MTAAPLLEQFAVLADPLRARMLAILAGHELTVSELCGVLQLPQSTVSRHLKTLGDGGWVVSRREGTSRFYGLPADGLEPDRHRLWRLAHEQVTRTHEAAQDAARLRGVLARRRAKSEAYFSSAAGQWDRVRASLFGPVSHLRPLLGLLDPGWAIGDLGCGTGPVSEALAPFARLVVAVDQSSEMLQAARERLAGASNVEFRRGSLEQLPLADAELDAAVLVLVLHHTAEPSRVLAEAARALRPGGRLVVADMLPHSHDEYRRTMGHVWLGFSERQFGRWCEAAGLAAHRWQPLGAEPGVKGPGMFVATATRTQVTDAGRPVSGS